jgi:hypothetical protein
MIRPSRRRSRSRTNLSARAGPVRPHAANGGAPGAVGAVQRRRVYHGIRQERRRQGGAHARQRREQHAARRRTHRAAAYHGSRLFLARRIGRGDWCELRFLSLDARKRNGEMGRVRRARQRHESPHVGVDERRAGKSSAARRTSPRRPARCISNARRGNGFSGTYSPPARSTIITCRSRRSLPRGRSRRVRRVERRDGRGVLIRLVAVRVAPPVAGGRVVAGWPPAWYRLIHSPSAHGA